MKSTQQRGHHKRVMTTHACGDSTVSPKIRSHISHIWDWNYASATQATPENPSAIVDTPLDLLQTRDLLTSKLIHFYGSFTIGDITGDLLYLPCYILTYTYNQVEYTAVMSAQTGFTTGDVRKQSAYF